MTLTYIHESLTDIQSYVSGLLAHVKMATCMYNMLTFTWQIRGIFCIY